MVLHFIVLPPLFVQFGIPGVVKAGELFGVGSFEPVKFAAAPGSLGRSELILFTFPQLQQLLLDEVSLFKVALAF